MRLPIFVTTLLLGTLQTLPIQALSSDLSKIDGQDTPVAVVLDAIEGRQGDLLARRPRPTSQSPASPPKRRSPSSTTQTPAKRPTRRAQPQRRSQPKTTTRRAQPQRRLKTPKAIQTKQRPPQPKPFPKNTLKRKPVNRPATVSKPNVAPPRRTVKKQPSSSPVIKKTKSTSSPTRITPNSKPSNLQKRKNATQKTAGSQARKTRAINTQKSLPTPKSIGGGNQPKPQGKTPAVKKRIKPAVAVKKVRDRPAVRPAKAQSMPIRSSKIRVRSNTNYQRRRASRRRRYTSNRYWGNRRVQTRRLTRSYRPCYYCPGRGWSYSPTCYTRPSRYYIFADSYWPNITSYRRSSRTPSSLDSQLIQQVESAIQDYASLYDLPALNDEIQVSQEGSIIILTGVVDQEDTLEDLIAIARDIDGVKYVVTDDVIVRELQDLGLRADEPLNPDTVFSNENGSLDENLSSPIDDFPSILREATFEEELETSIPNLDRVAAVEAFLP